MPVLDLLQAQIGLESTYGTAVAGTAKLMGLSEISMTPELEGFINQDMRGSLQPGVITTLGKVGASAKFKTKVLYQDFPYWLDGLFGRATPSGGNPYTYAYTAPTTAVPTNPRMSTFLYGDSTGTYKITSALVSALTVKGESNQEWMADVELFGQSVTTGTLAGLSDRTVAVAMGNNTSLWIDAWGGTIGTTAIATTAFAFELKLKPQRERKYYFGAATAGGFYDGRWMPEDNTLTLSLEFNATSKAYLDSIISSTALAGYQVRLQSTTGASAFCTFNFAGYCMEPPEIFTDRDGVSTLEITLQATYNPTLTNWFTGSVINAVSSLP